MNTFNMQGLVQKETHTLKNHTYSIQEKEYPKPAVAFEHRASLDQQLG